MLRFVVRLLAPLMLVLVIGFASAFAAIASIGGSDSCGGCDTQPAWSKVGLDVWEIGLVIWLIYAVVLIGRPVRAARRQRA